MSSLQARNQVEARTANARPRKFFERPNFIDKIKYIANFRVFYKKLFLYFLTFSTQKENDKLVLPFERKELSGISEYLGT